MQVSSVFYHVMRDLGQFVVFDAAPEPYRHFVFPLLAGEWLHMPLLYTIGKLFLSEDLIPLCNVAGIMIK